MSVLFRHAFVLAALHALACSVARTKYCGPVKREGCKVHQVAFRVGWFTPPSAPRCPLAEPGPVCSTSSKRGRMMRTCLRGINDRGNNLPPPPPFSPCPPPPAGGHVPAGAFLLEAVVLGDKLTIPAGSKLLSVDGKLTGHLDFRAARDVALSAGSNSVLVFDD